MRLQPPVLSWLMISVETPTVVQLVSPSDDSISTRTSDAVARPASMGYQFEAATASFELVVLKELGRFTPFFQLELFRIIGEQDSADRHMASALVKLRAVPEQATLSRVLPP